MTVRVDWETGVGSSEGFPGLLMKNIACDAKTGSTAKPFRCPTITARMCAALRCTFYPAMT
jgi:hypothetical protein